MSVERVEIDSDENGWLLVLDTDGDFEVDVPKARLSFRLPDDQAVALMEEVKQKIRPWHVEGESVRHDHARYQRTGELPDYMRGKGHSPEEAAEMLRRRAEDRPADGVPPTPGREEGDAHASPSDPWRGEHEAEGRAVEQHQEDKHAERLLDRADYERKRDRENR